MGVSPECRDLIERLLALDPRGRLGHRGAGEIKLHPWFEGVDWPSLARQKAAFIPAPDCETDTSYFSSKPVSQLSLALDLDSSRSEPEAGGLSPASLPTSRASSKSVPARGSVGAGYGAPSRRPSVRRRSLRHALVEPSAASWGSLASSSEGSNSRASLTGEMGGGGAEAAPAVEGVAGATGATAELLLLRRQSRMASGSCCAMSQDWETVRQPAEGPEVGPSEVEGDGLAQSSLADLPPAAPASSMGSSSSGRSELSDYTGSTTSGTPMSGDGGGAGQGVDEEGEGEVSPSFRNFSFRNFGLLAQQNMEALE